MDKRKLFDFLAQNLTEDRKALFEDIVQFRSNHVSVVLEDIFQPHNASAVLRTCDLLGVQKVHTIESRNDYQPNPEVAMGSHQWLERKSYSNSIDCIKALRNDGYLIVATSPHSDAYIPEDIPIDQPMALCFGTEKSGLSEYILKEADHHLRIPMFGFTESYNISVSAALCLYTITQRLKQSNIHWQLSEEEQLNTLLNWTRSSVKKSELLEARFLKDQLS